MGAGVKECEPVEFQALFFGSFTHNLDSKNRVTVPRKLLDKVKSGHNEPPRFYLTFGLDECLFLFTEEKWSQIFQRLDGIPLGTTEARDVQRIFYSNTHEVEVDGAGRILIPDSLKKKGKLEREVIFIGVGSRIELWNPTLWDSRQQRVEGGYQELAKTYL
jgi:MraZ protein